MVVGLLTLEQQNEIIGKELSPNWYFVPFMNNQFDWVITEVEIDNCTNPDYEWVNGLLRIDYEPITEYEFLQFLDYSLAETKLNEINECLELQAQIAPYDVYDAVTENLIGYAIIATSDVRMCLSETEINNIMTASTSEVVININ